MAGSEPALAPSARAALEKLADIVAPPPVSLVPQTWGWAVLGAAGFAVVAWVLLLRHRRRRANRYRAEALAELACVERFMASGGATAETSAAIAVLLKRVALAAWPRSRVASLAQGSWVQFLRATGGGTRNFIPLAGLLDDVEYRPPDGTDAPSDDDVRACARDARHWIEAHRVSA